MRRHPSWIALAGIAALGVAGCGGGGSSSGDTSTAASASGVHDVPTLYGKVAVPDDAKKIVAVSFPEATALADLGVKPVGIGSYIPHLPAYEKFFQGVPVVTDSAGKPDVEKVAAAEPELIIMDEFASDKAKNRGLYEQLESIAPTVVFEWQEAAGNWEADAQGTAEAIGQVPQMQTLKGAYEAHAAKIQKQYGKLLASHPVDLISGGESANWFLYSPTSSHGKVIAAAGGNFGAGANQEEGFAEYSPEKYPLLDKTDLIVLEEYEKGDAEEVLDNPLFANLPAVKAGNVMTTPYFFPSSYQVAEALLDDFEAFLGKVKE